jgi:hypothetical protein
MDEAKKKRLEEMLQSLLERELNQGKTTTPDPPRPVTGGDGRVIRRRKGQPDKRVP